MAARDRFVAEMGAALNGAGLPPLPSRVFSALMVDDDGRMTAAELAGSLRVSPAGVSGAVGYLERVGMIRREREPGSRRDVYVVDDDTWHEAMMRSDVTYGPMLHALSRAVDDLGTDTSAHQRLMLTREFLTFVNAEMNGMAERWERHKRRLLREQR
ncbi:MAG: MarR family transcriptional regulator [Actinomycetota bacterium]|nr:MarR family transcriptional regulator [Actinomycetota bacterium]